MFDVKFDFDEGKFKQRAMAEARKSFEAKVRQISCPEHHQTARLRFTGIGEKMSWEVQGCCLRLVEEVQNALR